MMKWKWMFQCALATAGFTAIAAPAVIDNPYGVCAHVSRGGELPIASQEFIRMQEAGINWVRTDFDWSGVEPKQGEWKFGHLDTLVPLAAKDKINILPILDYDVDWARPAWKNLEPWSEYIRRTVSRYSKQLRYWEVWNEQNHERFWKDTVSGTNYVPLLKRSYEEIKKIDPNLTVLYGGTAGVPLSYIEDSYKAGAGKYFDVMNVHPYNWQSIPEAMIPQLEALQALMKKYGLENKPLWITEVGWSTAKQRISFNGMLPEICRNAGIDPAVSTAALVRDPDMGYPGTQNVDPAQNFAGFKGTAFITLAQLKNLDVKQYPLLLPTLGEEFPAAYLGDLLDYVRRGGTLLLPAGLPFYYDLQLDGKGGVNKVQVNDTYLKRFRLGWDAWWTKEGVPKKETWQKLTPGFEKQAKPKFKAAGRFLHDRNLQPGDRFIPIIEAGTDNYKGVVTALYRFDSDLKGNIIVSTLPTTSETITEERQAEFLPRTYLIALSHGVRRIFWYNFRSGEWEPDEREAHFGIVRKDLSPKPGFIAYRTLTRLCPSGSTVPTFETSGAFYLSGWTRPDGVKVWALWALSPRQATLQVGGTITEARNHLGETVAVPSGSCTVGPGVLYLVGPDSVSIR